MNSKTTAAVVGTLAALIALPVFAQTGGVDVNASAGATVGGAQVQATAGLNVEARIMRAKERGAQEIDRRIKMLNALNARVQSMVRVSASVKASIAARVQTEVSNLTVLKTKITGDPDFDLLRVDIKSVTDSYRIFMLVIPQGRITVAADKIRTVADSMTSFSAKLAARVATAKTDGKDTASAEASLSDMNAKIGDAKVQADAAVSLVVNLTPDNGDKTKMDANNQALRDARAKIKAAMEDLQAARKDAGSIMLTLRGMNSNVRSDTMIGI